MADDLLPAGLISGWYGKSQFVQSSPSTSSNSWGVQRPGRALKFQYNPATIGAGFIACEGKRVCGATITSDGFGRWAVPNASDLPEVFNMMMASLAGHLRYFDQTVDKIHTQTSMLAKELNRTQEAVTSLRKEEPRGGARGTNQVVSQRRDGMDDIASAQVKKHEERLGLLEDQIEDMKSQLYQVASSGRLGEGSVIITNNAVGNEAGACRSRSPGPSTSRPHLGVSPPPAVAKDTQQHFMEWQTPQQSRSETPMATATRFELTTQRPCSGRTYSTATPASSLQQFVPSAPSTSVPWPSTQPLQCHNHSDPGISMPLSAQGPPAYTTDSFPRQISPPDMNRWSAFGDAGGFKRAVSPESNNVANMTSSFGRQTSPLVEEALKDNHPPDSIFVQKNFATELSRCEKAHASGSVPGVLQPRAGTAPSPWSNFSATVPGGFSATAPRSQQTGFHQGFTAAMGSTNSSNFSTVSPGIVG